jgi:hypothetical protein
MGTITRSLSNNITTGGVILPAGITNATVANITSFPNASGGTLVLLSTQTASASATVSFTTGLNSTYDAYEFHFINCHPATNGANFQFNGSTDSGSNYNVTKTTSVVVVYNQESGGTGVIEYSTSEDLAQSTAFQNISTNLANDADIGTSGVLTLFNPSSTTFVKHFLSRSNGMNVNSYSMDYFCNGYFNTTSAINAVQFKMSSGNTDDGIIKLYGLKKS